MLNAAAAVALARQIVGIEMTGSLLLTLKTVQPAFGRGETIILDGVPIELILVKNPSGFRLALTSFARQDSTIMIAINDKYADGRDMSWLWDVDFSRLASVSTVSGVRAYDMALRLQYDEVPVEKVEQDLAKALYYFINSHTEKPKQIFCSYTAMTAIRKLLSDQTEVEAIS